MINKKELTIVLSLLFLFFIYSAPRVSVPSEISSYESSNTSNINSNSNLIQDNYKNQNYLIKRIKSSNNIEVLSKEKSSVKAFSIAPLKRDLNNQSNQVVSLNSQMNNKISNNQSSIIGKTTIKRNNRYSPESQPKTPGTLTITYNAYYYSENGIIPNQIYGALVQLWIPSIIGPIVIQQGYLDENGDVTFLPVDPGTYAVAIFSEDQYCVKITDPPIWPYGSEATYGWVSPWLIIDSNEHINGYIEDENRAIWMCYHSIRYARQWLYEETGFLRGKVTV